MFWRADRAHLDETRRMGPKALPELDISGTMGVSLENALQRSSIQGSDQANVDGLTEEIITQQSRSRSPAAAGAPAVAGERAPLLFGLEQRTSPGDRRRGHRGPDCEGGYRNNPAHLRHAKPRRGDQGDGS